MDNITYNDHPNKATPVGADIIPLWDPSAGGARRATINAILNARLTGGGSIVTGGHTLTVPGTGTAALIETGTWTPVLADAYSGGNVAAIGTSDGHWVRIGNLVMLNWRCINITTAGMTAGTSLIIRNLPFAPAGTIPGPMMGSVRLGNINFSGFVVPAIFNVLGIALSKSISGSGGSNIIVGDVTSGTASLSGSISYLA